MREYGQILLRNCTAIKLEIFYVILSLFAGSILIFNDKRPSRYDFEDHWNRILQILSGQIIAVKNPHGNGYGTINSSGEFVEFNNTAINSPFAYFPSLLSGGNLRTASILTLLFSITFVTIAIHIAKIYRGVIFATAITPVFFLQSIYPTADAMADAIGLLFIAYILHVWQANALHWKHILVLSILGCALGQLKLTCAVFILLLGLPFFRLWTTEKLKSFFLSIPAICCAVSLLIWNAQTSNMSPAHGVPYTVYRAQMSELIHAPLSLFKSIIQTFFQPLDTTGEIWDTGRNMQFFMGAESTQLPLGIMLPLLIACMLIILKNSISFLHLSKLEISVIGATLICLFAAVCTAMLACWGIGSYAHGIQNRYFILTIPLIGLFSVFILCEFKKHQKLNIIIAAMVIWGYIGILIAHLMPIA